MNADIVNEAIGSIEAASTEDTPEPAKKPCACSGGTTPANPKYVYALGRIEARFPSVSVEKEYAQLVGRSNASGMTDHEALHAVLSQPQNRYLARQMCFVMSIEGMDTYVLVPRDPADLDRLIEATRSAPSPLDIDAVVGVLGPVAPPTVCGGLSIPIVFVDQVYSFDRASLLGAIPRPDDAGEKQFMATADEVLERVMQSADNAGATDAHRALNYLALRYPAIYAEAFARHAANFSLAAIDARPSTLGNGRNVFDVVYAFTHRQSDFTEKRFCRVDVTDQFPFLVTKLSPYYDK